MEEKNANKNTNKQKYKTTNNMKIKNYKQRSRKDDTKSCRQERERALKN